MPKVFVSALPHCADEASPSNDDNRLTHLSFNAEGLNAAAVSTEVCCLISICRVNLDVAGGDEWTALMNFFGNDVPALQHFLPKRKDQIHMNEVKLKHPMTLLATYMEIIGQQLQKISSTSTPCGKLVVPSGTSLCGSLDVQGSVRGGSWGH
jgi:hypothetical protein